MERNDVSHKSLLQCYVYTSFLTVTPSNYCYTCGSRITYHGTYQVTGSLLPPGFMTKKVTTATQSSRAVVAAIKSQQGDVAVPSTTACTNPCIKTGQKKGGTTVLRDKFSLVHAPRTYTGWTPDHQQLMDPHPTIVKPCRWGTLGGKLLFLAATIVVHKILQVPNDCGLLLGEYLWHFTLSLLGVPQNGFRKWQNCVAQLETVFVPHLEQTENAMLGRFRSST